MIKRLIIKNYKGIQYADIPFHKGKNIIVGNNGSGKSTIIEALSLALGYGLKQFEITPFIFNINTWKDFSEKKEIPTVYIEVYFEKLNGLEEISGKNNLKRIYSPGIRLKICLDDNDFSLQDYNEYEIPCEYFKIERTWFSDGPINQRSIPYSIQLIDSTSSLINSRSNQFITRHLQSNLEQTDNIKMKSILRQLRRQFDSNNDMIEINNRLSKLSKDYYDKLSISVDLSTQYSWNTILNTFINEIPLSQMGLGEQCIFKSMLSLKSQANEKKDRICIIEEPESHLSHTKMYDFIKLIEQENPLQLIVTTHNSFIANRLDLTNLIVISNSNGQISVTTLNNSENKKLYNYFAKTGDYPTLRLVLCNRAILVEGPSDEMIVQYALNQQGKTLFEDGTELIVVGGTRFKNFIQLAKDLQKPIAIITDNDNNSPTEVKAKYDIDYDKMNVFSQDEGFRTLEPAFVEANINNLDKLAEICDFKKGIDKDSLIKYISADNRKTMWALNVLMCDDYKFNVPKYILNAIKWIYEQ